MVIGTVKIKMLLPDGNTRMCTLKKILYVPNLTDNLLSVSKVMEAGYTTKFSGTGCEIVDQREKVIALTTRVGNLYYLEYCCKEEVNMSDSKS